ncbi:hypothetical protein [Modestobacter sp. SYSU DS0511]
MTTPSSAGELAPRVCLFPDYTTEWPLWTTGMTPGYRLGLSPELQLRLREWAAFFDAHFHHEDGWDHPGHRSEFAARGEELAAALRAELPGSEVVYDDWATRDPSEDPGS